MRPADRQASLGVRFRDGLGTRVTALDDPSGDTVELFFLCPELGAYERSIKERTERLTNFRHPRFAAVRGVRLGETAHGRVAVVADYVVGPRLSEILLAASRGSVVVDVHATLHLLRELLNAVGVLHDSRNVTHGAIAPQRLIVTPRGRLVIVEYTIGLALERLQYNRLRLWRDFRIAVPPSAGPARFDRLTDIVQIGHVALAMLTGRLFEETDQAPRVKALLADAVEVTTRGERRPLSDGLASWLERMLGSDTRKPFTTIQQAVAALDQVIAKEKRLGVAPAALKALATRHLSGLGTSDSRDGASAEPPEPADRATSGPDTRKESEITVANEPAGSVAERRAPGKARPAGTGAQLAIDDEHFYLHEVTAQLMQAEDPVVRAILTMPMAGAREEPPETATQPAAARAPRTDVRATAKGPAVQALRVDSAVPAGGLVECERAPVEPEASGDYHPDDDRPVDEQIAEAAPPVVVAVADLVAQAVDIAADRLEEFEPIAPPSSAGPSVEADLECASGKVEPLSLASFVETVSPNDVCRREPSPSFEAPATATIVDRMPEAEVGAPSEVATRAADAEDAAIEALVEEPVPEAIAEEEIPATVTTVDVAIAEEITDTVEVGATDAAAIEAVPESAAQIDFAVREDASAPAPEAPEPSAASTAAVETGDGLAEAEGVAIEAEAPEIFVELSPQEEITAAREGLRQLIASIRAKWFSTGARVMPRPDVEPSGAGPATLPPERVEARPPAAVVTALPDAIDAGGLASAAHAPSAEQGITEAAIVPPAAIEPAPSAEASVDDTLVVDHAAAESAAPEAVASRETQVEAVEEVFTVEVPDMSDVAAAFAALVEAAPIDVTPLDATPAEAILVEAAPIDVTPLDATPAEAIPVEPAPIDVTPLDATPAEAIPVEPTPVDVTPADTLTVNVSLSLPVAEEFSMDMVPAESPASPGVAAGEETTLSAAEIGETAVPGVPAAGAACVVAEAEPAADEAPLEVAEAEAALPAVEAPGIDSAAVETALTTDLAAVAPEGAAPAGVGARGQVLIFTAPAPVEAPSVVRPVRPRVRWRRMAAIAATLLLVGVGGVRLVTAHWFRAPFSEGSATIESVPPGLEVRIDGVARGVTPLTLSLPSGEHPLELRGRGLTRSLPLRVIAGQLAYERLTWPASMRTGALRVESQPPGARVIIDGVARGVTPVTVVGLSTRTHMLIVEGRNGRVEQRVRIEPETTTEVRVEVYSGWLQVAARLDLQIVENGRLIGTSDVERIMMPAGRHTIDLVAGAFGYMETREIEIQPGGLTRVAVDMPPGSVLVEAPAGYEVYLDGERVGTAPIGPIEAPLGTHNIRIKGPRGEQQRAFVVTVTEPARVVFSALH